MPLRALSRLGLALVVLATAACGPPIDLTKALEVTDVLTGFYDDGVQTKSLGDGLPPRPTNVLKPSITFKLKNISAQSLTSVQLMASFWQAGGDGEWDSIMATAISFVDAYATERRELTVTDDLSQESDRRSKP